MAIARRSLLAGFASLFAAPAIVHTENIMPVSSAWQEMLDAQAFYSFPPATHRSILDLEKLGVK